MTNDIINKAYLSIIKEQVEDETVAHETCPECGNNPCTCKDNKGCCEDFANFADLIEKFSAVEPTKEGLISLLNIAVNDEMLATYNYLASYTLSKTSGKSDFDPEFKDHESDEFKHYHDLIERLRQLNANVLCTDWCCISKTGATGAEWSQETDSTSTEILLRRYQEELVAIEFYSFLLSYIKKLAKDDFDSTTYTLIKKIKADEEEHANDLRDLLTEYDIEVSEDINPEAYKSEYATDDSNEDESDALDDEEMDGSEEFDDSDEEEINDSNDSEEEFDDSDEDEEEDDEEEDEF